MYLHTLMPTPKQSVRKTLVAEARAAVDACAGWNARLAARRITGFLNRRMQDSGLSLAQFGLMAQIASAGDDTLSELAQRTGLDQSTLSRNLQVLEAAGLVEIAAADRDARRRAVRLTEKRGAESRGGARRLEAGACRTRQTPRPGGRPTPGCRGRGAGRGLGRRLNRKWFTRWRGEPFWRGDSRETEAREAEQHHRPGRGLWYRSALHEVDGQHRRE